MPKKRYKTEEIIQMLRGACKRSAEFEPISDDLRKGSKP
jgi:hypothetical protein